MMVFLICGLFFFADVMEVFYYLLFVLIFFRINRLLFLFLFLFFIIFYFYFYFFIFIYFLFVGNVFNVFENVVVQTKRKSFVGGDHRNCCILVFPLFLLSPLNLSLFNETLLVVCLLEHLFGDI